MIRGLERSQEQDPSLFLRDTRTLGQKTREFLSKSINSAAMFVVLAGCVFFFPAVADILVVIGLLFGFYCYRLAKLSKLPFRLPMRTGLPDHNDLNPGNNKPKTAAGICFFGNEKGSNEEIWFNNDDLRTHALIFGSTGSGKTVTLVGLAYNALVMGSGFIYVDGKGDNSLFAQIFSVCRSMGREDDLLVINFMTGARDIIGAQEAKLSNTLNPFSKGSSSMLIQLVVSLMPDSGGGGDGDMWKGRAINFIESVMKVLVYMRDEGKILLDANTIRNYFHLTRLEQMVVDKSFPRDNEEAVSLADAPELVMEPLYNYVMTLPGYDPKKKGKQVSQVLEQHGFITMQLVRVFGSLADTYSHIIRTNLPEVDMQDVVLNRRILLVLLPALEKSPEELSNLGKIVIATLKAMMASGLGDKVEGSYTDVIDRKPTTSPSPYMCILDEYGYYAVKGFAVVPAQARSLGFSTIFAGQDLPAFQKASKEEAASIGANTNIKICMKLEDPTETWEFFSKTAGESYVTKVDSFQTDSQSMMNNYMDTRSASVEKRARVDLLDLKDQGVGEAHIFFKSTIVRAKCFFANPKIAQYMRLNHFMKVQRIPDKQLLEFEKCLDQFESIIESESIFPETVASSEELETLVTSLQAHQDKAPFERAVLALQALAGDSVSEDSSPEAGDALHSDTDQATDSAPEEEVFSDTLNIFVRIRLPESIIAYLGEALAEEFTQVLLVKKQLQSKVSLMERMLGKTADQANSIAIELVRDMEVATAYPPYIDRQVSVSELIESATIFTDYLIEQASKSE
jgi:intracellular multiplication protein IcmO